MKRFITTMSLMAALMLLLAPAALAGELSDQETKEAAGWSCDLAPGHCISPGTAKNFERIAANGQTFQIMVYGEDGNFLAAEIGTFKTSADGRACPNDPESDDGTYWSPLPGLYVCHHQPG